jgi:hypothetical protein
LVGLGVGIGGVQVEGRELSCTGCGNQPVATDFNVHIGGWAGTQTAMLLELQGSAQTIEMNDSGAVRMAQLAAMVGGQYWLTPRLWLKGGIGASTVATRSDKQTERVDSGLALMCGVGYELSGGERYSVEVLARLTSGNYDWFGQVRAASIGVGLNWY